MTSKCFAANIALKGVNGVIMVCHILFVECLTYGIINILGRLKMLFDTCYIASAWMVVRWDTTL